ncbi:MAG: efflux RND transporter periplasmic adaptor subunit [Candidatus Omnitrophica bacterium]|nr:efflux RND transporter periplasmic adaptor subunit [Candidatus Omnitrophota bacterium]MCA9441334.1 efflux RND transporter periplasmic adaptor subunit [Candidatus Omnitrophota bacterium]MCB9768656.1 efflux RND transporter periplasmic adaptor subunit [Candidatus Omnitrophota bacterium]MCB9783548.1 efflux RND transporter periplasmic adaptor subunit [Candidatus Omnitrophota bacterium]
MKYHSRVFSPITSILASLLLMVLGCQKPNEFAPPPPPEVTVAQPIQREITNYLESTGRTKEVAKVELRPRVSGYLESIHFTDGDMVKKGQLLYVIDPRPFQAQLNQAKAQLAQANAEFANAQSLFERTQNLFEQGATTDKDLTERRAEKDAALARIEAASATVMDASLSLGFTHIRAPMDGRIGEHLVDIGNLVGSGENTLLATLVSYSPIYVYFTVPERELLSLIEKSKAERTSGEEDGAMPPAFLGLADDEGYPHEGRLDFSDLGVDPNTGSMRLRAVFENQDIKYPDIVPGLFARVRLPIDREPNALLVPEKAVSTDQTGKYLLVVDDEDKVHKKNVTLGNLIQEMRVIEGGIEPEDWVVIEGVQKARPGAMVQPSKTDLSSATSEIGTPQDYPTPRTLLGNPGEGNP